MSNKLKFVTLLMAVLLVVPAFGQDAPKAEIVGQFSLLRFNPTITGVESHTSYGGGGSFTYFANKAFGITAEFNGYRGTTITTKLPANPAYPTGTYASTSGTQMTYLFGPQIKFRAGKVAPFGEVLFGSMSTSLYSGLKCQTCIGSTTLNVPTQHPFTLAFGGGLDINASPKVAIRLGQFDYLMTRFTNPFTSTNNQNNFRFQAGVVFKLGSH